jgi:Raf kinase inhibitor-like YbhB/YbcL family protein
MRRRWVLLGAVLAAAGCGGGGKAGGPLPAAPRSMRLESPAVRNGAEMPRRFTCDGAGASPPLRWSGVPTRARELALIVEDPDAGGFVHWTVLGIPPGAGGLAQGGVPAGAVQTKNSFGQTGWGGPCPPKGSTPHRYVFVLYALDRRLGVNRGAAPQEVGRAIQRAAIGQGKLTARYGRRR